MERRHSIARDAQILRAFGGSGKVQETEHPTVIAKRLGLRRVPQSDVELDACADVVRKMLPSPAMTMIKFKASMSRLKRCTVAAQRAVRAHLARRNAALACVFHGLFRTPRLGQAVCSEVAMALAQKLFASWWTRCWMVLRREMPRARSVAAMTAKRNAALYRRRRRQKLEAQSWGPDPKSCQCGAWRFASEVLRQSATALREQLHAESEAARALDSRAAVALMLRDELPPPVPRPGAPALTAAVAVDPSWMTGSAEDFKRVMAEVRTRDEVGCVWQCYAVPWTNAFGAFDVARRLRGLEVDRMVAQLVATCGEDPSAIPRRLSDGSPVDINTDAVDTDQLAASTLSASLARATSPLSPTRRGGDASPVKRVAQQRAKEREEFRREQMRRSLFGQRKTQRAAVLEEFIASEEAVVAAKEGSGEPAAAAATAVGSPVGSPLAQSRKTTTTEAPPDDPKEWLEREVAAASRAVVEREMLEREVVPRPQSALAQRHARASSLAAYYAKMPQAAAEDAHLRPVAAPSAVTRTVPARQQQQVRPGSGQRPCRPWSAYQERRGHTPAVDSRDGRRSRSRSPGGHDPSDGAVTAEQLDAQHASIEERKKHAWERLALAKRNCAVSFDSRVGALAIPDVIRAAAEARGRSPVQTGLQSKGSTAAGRSAPRNEPGAQRSSLAGTGPGIDSYAAHTQSLFDRKRLLVPGKGNAESCGVIKMPLAEASAASALHQRLDGIREAREKRAAATLGFVTTSTPPPSAGRRRKR